ncbi:MAG: hypothetical protein NW241_21385 [Bacteroidia bacterium]|nr:hypothetical protein [Bacteroidia bacterium]
MRKKGVHAAFRRITCPSSASWLLYQHPIPGREAALRMPATQTTTNVRLLYTNVYTPAHAAQRAPAARKENGTKTPGFLPFTLDIRRFDRKYRFPQHPDRVLAGYLQIPAWECLAFPAMKRALLIPSFSLSCFTMDFK